MFNIFFKVKFVPNNIIRNLKKVTDSPVKLIEHLESLNTAYSRNHYMNSSIIIRAILDYIPTIFGYSNVNQLHSQLNGQQTFKKSLFQLDLAIRNIADDSLHNPASKNELLKVSKQTIDNQSGNILIVIDHTIKQLNTNDLRDKLINPQHLKLNENKSQLEIFEKYIEKENWYKETIDHVEIWICKSDNMYQIRSNDDYGDFSEPWTQVYPDALGSGKHSVDLLYASTPIKRFTFIYCDGGRISVALPSFEKNEKMNEWEGKDLLGRSYKNTHYYWLKSNLEFKISKIIGSFYIYQDIYGVAKMSKIEIR